MVYDDGTNNNLTKSMTTTTYQQQFSSETVTTNKKEENTGGSISRLRYHEGGTLPDNAPSWAIAASERIKESQKQKQTSTTNGDDDNGDNNGSNNHNMTLEPPPGVSRVLLHSCCAPCSGAMVQEMMDSLGITTTTTTTRTSRNDDDEEQQKNKKEVVVFFYNPNIHPRKEYEIRKEENKKFCQYLGIEFVDCDYDVENWYKRVKGMEYDPERGRRCTECFDMRMERTALYAYENGFDTIATTNATSRWKDMKQVDESGYRAVSRYDGDKQLTYWAANWQSDILTMRKYEISAAHQFYKQEYCGCSYSLRDSNDWRKANGIPPIQIGGETAGLGERYFTDPVKDAAEESQEVVDEFFAQAQEIAQAGRNRTERKKKLAVYKDRRKNEAHDGIVNGINNW